MVLMYYLIDTSHRLHLGIIPTVNHD